MQEVSESSAVQNMCKELVDQNAQGKMDPISRFNNFCFELDKGKLLIWKFHAPVKKNGGIVVKYGGSGIKHFLMVYLLLGQCLDTNPLLSSKEVC